MLVNHRTTEHNCKTCKYDTGNTLPDKVQRIIYDIVQSSNEVVYKLAIFSGQGKQMPIKTQQLGWSQDWEAYLLAGNKSKSEGWFPLQMCWRNRRAT